MREKRNCLPLAQWITQILHIKVYLQVFESSIAYVKK